MATTSNGYYPFPQFYITESAQIPERMKFPVFLLPKLSNLIIKILKIMSEFGYEQDVFSIKIQWLNTDTWLSINRKIVYCRLPVLPLTNSSNWIIPVHLLLCLREMLPIDFPHIYLGPGFHFLVLVFHGIYYVPLCTALLPLPPIHLPQGCLNLRHLVSTTLHILLCSDLHLLVFFVWGFSSVT